MPMLCHEGTSSGVLLFEICAHAHLDDDVYLPQVDSGTFASIQLT